MSTQVSRRRFLGQTSASVALGAGIAIVPSWARGNAPSEKLNVAVIGVAGRGGDDLNGVAHENIVALCDVDKNSLAGAAKRFPKAKTFADFRKMLASMEKQIDAVVVGTPDHTHAVAGVMALRMDKHCYCEKPLTHSLYEARLMAQLAQEKKLVTQMGTQIHSMDNYRRVVELIEAKAIGEVRDVQVWSAASYSLGNLPAENPPVPANLDWDLWLGPAKFRPYSPKIAPFGWRGVAAFGHGGLGDFFCHYVDLVFWALKLRHPTTIEAEGPKPDPVATPPWLIVRYEYPERNGLPPVKLTWHDGGKRPAVLKEVADQLTPKNTNAKPGDAPAFNWPSGVLFIGDKGMLLADYTRHVLLPESQFKDFKRPPKTIPDSIGHHKEWTEACKTGGPTTCNFNYSGALTESALLGTVAYRAGEKIEWNANELKAVNTSKADEWIRHTLREGWTL
jgi:predicted dehydrogenase